MKRKDDTPSQYHESIASLISDAAEIPGLLRETTANAVDLIRSFSSDLFKRNLEVDEFATSYSKMCDTIISNAKKTDQLNYVSGTFYLQSVDVDHFVAGIHLYFQSQQRNWIQKKVATEPMLKVAKLTGKAIAELDRKAKIQFEVEAPAI
jgi:hypothetical protein